MLRTNNNSTTPQWTKAASKQVGAVERSGREKLDSDDDGQAVPTYQEAFSDAIQAAIDKHGDCAAPLEQGRKNKKPKKKLLFTTTMNRAL